MYHHLPSVGMKRAFPATTEKIVDLGPVEGRARRIRELDPQLVLADARGLRRGRDGDAQRTRLERGGGRRGR